MNRTENSHASLIVEPIFEHHRDQQEQIARRLDNG